jgi:hypothetical protein
MAAGMLASAILSTLMVVVFPAVTKLVVDEVLPSTGTNAWSRSS